MSVPITVPKAGLTMTDGVIEKWFVKVGSHVGADEAVAEISTEKVTIEVLSPVDGTISEICFNEGDVIKVGEEIAKISLGNQSSTKLAISSGNAEFPLINNEYPSSNESDVFEAVVIGGGPGGYVAALRVAQLGGKVALVEKDKLGGICLNKGCIPTKTLLQTAELFRKIKVAAEYGIHVQLNSLNIEEAYQRKDRVIENLNKGIETLLEKAKVKLIRGTAEIIDETTVRVVSDSIETLHAKNIIIATGSRPAPLKLEVSHGDVLTSDELLKQPVLPKSLVIIGGGYIGMEFASLFSGLGVKVTVVEAQNRVLSSLDFEIADELIKLMKKEKVEFYTDSHVLRVKRSGDEQKVVVIRKENEEHELYADIVLSAVGRVPVLPRLGPLEHLVVNGALPVDEKMRTAVPSVYAIGDVTGGIQLAHAASTQGIVAAKSIMGIESCYKPKSVPAGIFTYPEIAFVGATEDDLKSHGIEYSVGKFSFRSNGRALSRGESHGFVKILSGKIYGEILGVHIVGVDAVDLIAEAVLAISLEATTDELIRAIHVHPSLSEAIAESAMDSAFRPLHKLKTK